MPNAQNPCLDETLFEHWYTNLRDEVDYHCTFCDSLHLTIEELEVKVRNAYSATADSMREIFDVKEIANRWLGMYFFGKELLASAETLKDAHQICGADLNGIRKYTEAALELFKLHCPQADPA